MTNASPTRPRGRPRTFDRDAALNAAVGVFWSMGYAATSVDDLADAMGISLSSLYAAFGDKAALFREAVARYQAQHGGYAAHALAMAPTRRAVESLLLGAVEQYRQPQRPTGCLVLLNGISAAGETDVAGFLARENETFRALVEARLEAGLKAGDALPAPPRVLARYLVLIMTGIAVSARQGADKDSLEAAVGLALQCWPAR